VLEFNCRFGDPETQPIMCRLQSDLVALCLAACDGKLDEIDIDWDPRAAVGVVMASAGYPGAYEKGAEIRGLQDAASMPHSKVFHAGTRADGNRVVTDGGRVLCVVGLGASVSGARERSYAAVARIGWSGAFYREDIAYRAIAREQTEP
jgi:phosphoribosylamine--glycine ligase